MIALSWIVSDAETVASAPVVTATTIPPGIQLTNLTNTTGRSRPMSSRLPARQRAFTPWCHNVTYGSHPNDCQLVDRSG